MTVLTAAALVAAACATEASSGDGTGAGDRGAGALGLTEAELQYGLAPEPHPDVTYAPDVVLVGGGGESVRSVTGDGLTWTIDAGAPRADQLEVGKVMFLTGRGVGRVHAVEVERDDLVVTLGPVDITEVIWDGEFAMEDQELDLDRMVVYDTGEQAWSVTDLPPTEDDELVGEPGAGDDPGPPGIRRRSPAPPQADDPPPPETVALRVTVGIGWEVFNVGPYAELVSSVGLYRGSDLAAPLAVCRGVTVTASLGYGIGYSLPKVVVEVVNFILRLVGTSTVAETGSLVGDRIQFVNETARAPSAAACQD